MPVELGKGGLGVIFSFFLSLEFEANSCPGCLTLSICPFGRLWCFNLGMLSMLGC